MMDHTVLPAFTPAEAGTQFNDPGGMQGSVGWWLYSKIFNPLNTVTYLRNNQAVL